MKASLCGLIHLIWPCGADVIVDEHPRRLTPLACTELPGNGFPGSSAAVTHQAWPSGYQPLGNECWPRKIDGSLAPCWNTTAVYDTRAGWLGKCQGLHAVSNLDASVYGEDPTYSCASSCTEAPACAVWKMSSDHQCWHGVVGSSCAVDSDDEEEPLAAQRIQHGNVRVLRTLLLMEVFGLQHEEMAEILSTEESISHCKALCYSSIDCHYWQYGNGGCYIEDTVGGQSIPYPFTNDHVSYTSDFASHVQAGEYIQHFCPAAQARV